MTAINFSEIRLRDWKWRRDVEFLRNVFFGHSAFSPLFRISVWDSLLHPFVIVLFSILSDLAFGSVFKAVLMAGGHDYRFDPDSEVEVYRCFFRTFKEVVVVVVLFCFFEMWLLGFDWIFSQILLLFFFSGQQAPVKNISIRGLLPDTEYYMTYEGSITRPGCHETVTWIILNKPIYITKQQVRKNDRVQERVGGMVIRGSMSSFELVAVVASIPIRRAERAFPSLSSSPRSEWRKLLNPWRGSRRLRRRRLHVLKGHVCQFDRIVRRRIIVSCRQMASAAVVLWTCWCWD